VLSLTRKTEYALVAMTELARKAPANVSAREIGQTYRLPLPALTNILNLLARHDLVTSTRGAKGGYRLARDATMISLSDVIHGVEGNSNLTACCADGLGGSRNLCEFHSTCPVSESIQDVNGMVQEVLNRVTLDQVARNDVPGFSTLAQIAPEVVTGRITSPGAPAEPLGDRGRGDHLSAMMD
jgi:Rrf2 family protein